MGRWDHKETTLARFERYYVKDASGCWLWQGCVQKTGYGRFKLGIVSKYAHRVSYELYKEKNSNHSYVGSFVQSS